MNPETQTNISVANRAQNCSVGVAKTMAGFWLGVAEYYQLHEDMDQVRRSLVRAAAYTARLGELHLGISL